MLLSEMQIFKHIHLLDLCFSSVPVLVVWHNMCGGWSPSSAASSWTASKRSLIMCTLFRGWVTQLRIKRLPMAVFVWLTSHSNDPLSLPSSLLRKTSSCLCICSSAITGSKCTSRAKALNERPGPRDSTEDKGSNQFSMHCRMTTDL